MSNIKNFFLFFIFFFILNYLNGQEIPKTKSYYVVDSYCCGGEDSDPHAVFGIESPDGYVLLGKSLDNSFTEKNNTPQKRDSINHSQIKFVED